MGTKIEWAEESWNPVTGCSPVSEGCENCYARRMAQRFRGRGGYPVGDPFRVTLHEERLGQPLRWRQPKRVFVCSMGDLFHPDVPVGFIAEVFETMASWRLTCRKKDCGHEDGACVEDPKHIYLILTKRPERARELITRGIPEYIGENWPGDTPLNIMLDVGVWPLTNVWLGVTAENQRCADERIPALLEIPAVKHFVSIEPCLGPVELRPGWIRPQRGCGGRHKHGQRHEDGTRGDRLHHHHDEFCGPRIDWVVLGGETGPGARPMDLEWARQVRNECLAARVPFFFKQTGRRKRKPGDRILDGREWNEYPNDHTN